MSFRTAQRWNALDTCLCTKRSLPASHNRSTKDMLESISPIITFGQFTAPTISRHKPKRAKTQMV